MKLQQFLIQNKFEITISRGDGHCLLYSMVTSFTSQLNIKVDLNKLKSYIFIETIKNASLYANFLIDCSQKTLLNSLNKYLLQKCYNSSYGDIIPLIIANAFKAKLFILNETHGNSFEKFEITPCNCEPIHEVYLHRINDHYNGITRAPIIPVFNITGAHNVKKPSADKIITGNKIIKYSSDQLRSFANTSNRIPRAVRKTIFALSLWKPKDDISKQRPWDTNNGPHHHLNRCLPKSNTVYCRGTNIHCAMVNAQSIRNKVDDFMHHVTSEGYDICAVTETWLRDEDPTDAIIIQELSKNGYSFTHAPRKQTTRGGGLGLLHKSNLGIKTLSSKVYSTFESCLWNIRCRNTDFIIMGIYRPPYSPKNKKTIPMFNNEFCEVWSQVLTSYPSKRIILLGDFNIHVNDSSNADSSAFLELLDSFNCNQHIKFQTHENGHTLDLCITPNDSDLLITDLSADYYISDHTFIGFNINVQRPPPTRGLLLNPDLLKRSVLLLLRRILLKWQLNSRILMVITWSLITTRNYVTS